MSCFQDTIENLIIIRPGETADQSFIYSTWLRGLYYGNDTFRQMKASEFYRIYAHVIECLMKEPDVCIDIAVLEDELSVILGYSVYNKNCLHWVYVKSAWRKAGIAKMLIPNNINSCSHLTRIGLKLKPSTWEFNPFL